ncbi:hypothetical protein ACLOJK_022979, partial [Asimina triloba]
RYYVQTYVAHSYLQGRCCRIFEVSCGSYGTHGGAGAIPVPTACHTVALPATVPATGLYRAAHLYQT